MPIHRLTFEKGRIIYVKEMLAFLVADAWWVMFGQEKLEIAHLDDSIMLHCYFVQGVNFPVSLKVETRDALRRSRSLPAGTLLDRSV